MLNAHDLQGDSSEEGGTKSDMDDCLVACVGSVSICTKIRFSAGMWRCLVLSPNLLMQYHADGAVAEAAGQRLRMETFLERVD